MILETLVTTQDVDGHVNVAPMGVEWGDDALVLKPFLETATFRNLEATRAAVVNLVDDVRLFARAALGNPDCAVHPAQAVPGVVLAEACSWREVSVQHIDASPPRARVTAGVVHRGVHREFLGYNRARHAVLEAAIHATRLHLLAPAFVRAEMARLQVIVDKTAGPAEQEAMRWLQDHVHAHLGAGDR